MTQYKPLVSIIKEALMKKYNLIQNQSLPCQIFKETLNPRINEQLRKTSGADVLSSWKNPRKTLGGRGGWQSQQNIVLL